MMVQHHGEALRQQAKLVQQLKLTSADSATAAKLKADAAKTLETLRSTDAAGFDAAYLTSQVEGHEKVLELIDAQLLPAAKTPEVLDVIKRARGVVENHLSEARSLQSK